MKSILFTHFRNELLSGEKTQTGRTTFFPNYYIGDEVNIDFKHENGMRERLFIAEIIDIYTKEIKDYTLEEAKRDGFESIESFQKGIMEINKVKRMDHLSALTIFKRISEPILEIINKPIQQQNQQLDVWMGEVK